MNQNEICFDEDLFGQGDLAGRPLLTPVGKIVSLQQQKRSENYTVQDALYDKSVLKNKEA